MQIPDYRYKKVLLVLGVVLLSGFVWSQELYWIGGTGDWEDIRHWSKESGSQNAGPAGLIPGPDVVAIIDNFSGLVAGSVITIPPGDHEVRDLVIMSGTGEFTMNFAGSQGNFAGMTVYGNLVLDGEMNLTYTSPNRFHNSWYFEGDVEHDIRTAGKNLLSVEFFDEDGVFNQLDDLEATEYLRMHAGTWNSNGQDVNAGTLLFRDNNSPANATPKTFNTAGSDIRVDLWDSRLSYQSLTVNGAHQIYAEQFLGSPSTQFMSFQFDEVHLLEFPDDPPFGSQIEYNNFECTYCEVNKLIIDDTGNSRLAGIFTIVNELVVSNPGSVIQFNGGNGREDEVIINGTISTPGIGGCSERTVFENVFNDFTTFTRSAGILTLRNAVVDNIQASGGATFNLNDGVLQGVSSGWNLTGTPSGLDYIWIGIPEGVGDWDEPNNWRLASGGFSGCVPSISDNVFIDENVRGSIRIPESFTAECHDFIWENEGSTELLLDGDINQSSRLKVSGSFFLSASATISYENSHRITFASASNISIETNGVPLPIIYFEGSGTKKLTDGFTCLELYFDSGTLDTNGNDISTDFWLSLGNNAKQYNFGSSTITVNGECQLSRFPGNGVSVNAGSSLIVCEKLESAGLALNDVQLNNGSTMQFPNFATPSSFNRLLLAGSGEVRTGSDVVVKDLVFISDAAGLAIRVGDVLTVTGTIESEASSGTPASLKSTVGGVRATIARPEGNLCATGPINIQDIETAFSGVFNAPDATDDGNNEGINFNRVTTPGHLYWVGGSGEWSEESNWSQVSGGCPSTKQPGDALRLYIDNNGLFNDPEEIVVSGIVNCNELYLVNSASRPIFDVMSTLKAVRVVIDGGQAEISGKTLDVSDETLLENGGLLITDMLDFSTSKLTGNSGLYIVRPGSNAKVTAQ